MIQVSVYYPSSEGSTFDHDYYRNTHVPLVQKAWNPVSTMVEKGVNRTHVAAVHVTFASMDAFNAAMGSPLTGDVMTDVANYTNIAPVMQISEVVD
ncbi:MAG: EthD family reductase [Ilumatobacteraceae bacterium]